MEKVGMSNQTKRLHEAYIEAKNTMATLRAKIKTLEPFYQRSKAIYEHARLVELKNMDHELYLKTEEWQRTRLDAIERARGVCEKCGSNESLQAHHLTYERKGEELPEDLIVLCDKCHEKEHGLLPEMAKE
jgi:hypothetical protein